VNCGVLPRFRFDTTARLAYLSAALFSSAAEAQPLRIESMRPVGNYAYNIAFSDGHNSGIYSFAMLKRENFSQG
jgi:hypothetical protein